MSTNYKSADLSEWISLAEAARIRGVSRQAMSKLVKQGRFDTLNVGGRQLVHKAQVAGFAPKPAGRRVKKIK